jgi:hypothetical protein
MKDIYTITRWDNGWSVEVKTNEGTRDYTGVSEDPFWVEDEELSKAQSLAELLFNTFEKFLATEEKCGMVIEFEEPGEPEEANEEEEGEDDDDGRCEGDAG